MHRIYQFGAVALPPALPEDDLSTGAVDSTIVDSVGGVFDAWGAVTRRPRRQVLNLRGMYELTGDGVFVHGNPLYLVDHGGNNIVDHAGNRIIADSAPAALQRAVDLLKAQIGTRQKLYRRAENDGAVTWRDARLLRVGHVRTVDDAGAVARLEMAFETHQAEWRANALTTLAAALPAGLLVVNSGSMTVHDATLAILATDAITWITISGPGSDLTWTGALGAGSTLIIDAGAQTVRIGGSDYYSGLVRGAGHTAATWLTLAPGMYILSVTANAAGTATLTYYEQSQ
jgi:hypothetical protein